MRTLCQQFKASFCREHRANYRTVLTRGAVGDFWTMLPPVDMDNGVEDGWPYARVCAN